MYADVAELREFYTSSLGQTAQRWLRRHVRGLWPNVRGQAVLALGYGTPLLRPFLDEAERVLAFMPGAQGVVNWPSEGPNRTALVEDTALPLLDASVDRVIILHALESVPQPARLLDEAWRVLTSGGRLIVIAPNRTSWWALSDTTPFGHGAAFSQRQIRALLKQHGFIPEQSRGGLFFPPSAGRIARALTPILEKTGPSWLGPVAGVHLIEASKQLYAPVGTRVSAKSYIPRAISPKPISLRIR
jgi:SAM-dependent methyltransferase